MYPGHHAALTPDKPAQIFARAGEVTTYRELDERSCRLARLMWERGLRPGDHMAIFLENHPRYLEVVWAGLRSGLQITTVNRYLTAEEAAYIVDDCEARVLVTSRRLAEPASGLLGSAARCNSWLMIDDPIEGFESYEKSVAAHTPEPLDDERAGSFMLYSSGTTGRPKGIHRPTPSRAIREGLGAIPKLIATVYGVDSETVYLSPAPLYHSAPLAFCTGVQSLGGTIVLMDRFDAVESLRCIQDHRVSHSQWVPTMFTRMLKLPEEDRARFDLSSHRVAIHAAAPCPRQVKEQMFGWWGPILHEYYGGTELNGMTYVGPDDWLSHPGTVGRPILGTLHVCAEDGRELPPGEAGIVYFELPKRTFEYYNDPEKTRSVEHPEHPNWTALGDIGHVDEDGFLYLTDRATFMIISGGVNIYPQEIEDALVVHPKVLDVAVIGVPNEEMGEEVKAVVQLPEGVVPGPELEQEILAFAREHLAAYKCPRSVDFEPELPRLPTGKLYKRLLKDRYWGKGDSRIV